MTQNYYQREIKNEYLSKYRRVSGRTRRELDLKVAEQLQRWSEQESRARARAAAADDKARAGLDTQAAQRALEDHRSILVTGLGSDYRLNWEVLARPSEFTERGPTMDDVARHVPVPPKRPVAELFSKRAVSARLEAESAAERKLVEWEMIYQLRAAEHQRLDRERTERVGDLRLRYERAEPDAVEEYISLALASSVYPGVFQRDTQVAYSRADQTVTVNVSVPSPDEIPQITEYRYVAARQQIDVKRLKDRDLAQLYDEIVVQSVLRTLHEIFDSDYARHCQLAVVNATVEAVDRATGRDFAACIASCQAERKAFLQIDLSRVEPRACFRSLKAVSGSNLIGLQPVRPIRALDTTDSRFIEADAVLDGLDADQNLMMMDWQDFEVLIRDLFGQMFATRGAEVKVTRTSRDQGVDAVVFDPDPITGGKMVIQAKRYRNTVPVAAVRELYGTMLNEGAGKGLLVTTSQFGPTALEFAKDKPLTLIDGSHLLHLLGQHGHTLRIDLAEVRNDPELEPLEDLGG